MNNKPETTGGSTTVITISEVNQLPQQRCLQVQNNTQCMHTNYYDRGMTQTTE